MPDDLDRDKLYSADADDADYELEPLDPDVLSSEQRRTEEALADVEKSIDIDEIYRDAEGSRDSEILERWIKDVRLQGFRFQFQIKHLLIATAVLAMLLTLWRMGILGTVLVIAVMLGVGGISLYLQWQERMREAEAERRRRRMYAERRAHLDRQHRKAAAAVGATVADAQPLPPDEFEPARQPTAARREFRFQFSLRQFMLAITCAAAVLGLASVLGGTQNAATFCGAIALLGLIIHAMGFEPPNILVFGWWVMLLLYVVLSVFAVVWSGFGA